MFVLAGLVHSERALALRAKAAVVADKGPRLSLSLDGGRRRSVGRLLKQRDPPFKLHLLVLVGKVLTRTKRSVLDKREKAARAVLRMLNPLLKAAVVADFFFHAIP